jgi:N utilization substance protein A
MNAIDVDEVVGRLLASEGFRSVEELAYVELPELASIEGFDEETAGEIQNRAHDYLERIEAENEERRKALGVSDELRELDGMTTAMMVRLGENDVKTMEDFAGCVPDDLVGWTEKKDGETVRQEGFFEGIDLSREEAEAMIMAARVRAGWIEAPVAQEGEGEGAEATEAEGE